MRSASAPGSYPTRSSARRSRSPPFFSKGDSASYSCDALIIATGASARYLGLPSEEAFKGKGVSACATCDGFFLPRQGRRRHRRGSTAVEEALYLSNIASHVTVVHRRDRFRSEKILSDQLIAKTQGGNVTIEWNHNLEEVLGDASGVTGIRIRHTSGSDKVIPVHGCFIAIGPQAEHRHLRGAAGDGGRLPANRRRQRR